MRYRNDYYTSLTWPNLINADTGQTLHLAPDETANIDGPVDDPWLIPVTPEPTKTAKADKTEKE